jgi:type I restriction enzyme S subunit
MEVRAGYKQTDVGVIPKDWNLHTLKYLSDKIMVGIASAATHAYRNQGVVLLRNQNIKSGYLDDGDVLYIDPQYESVFKNKRLKTGDLLTARTGYPGTTCVVPSKYESAQSFTTLITRPKQMSIDSNYLCYYINSEKGQYFFEQNQIGGGQKNVNAGALQTMPIPFPSLPEQRTIATALSDMDALITSLDQLIAKKRDIKQAAMQELIRGKRRLPGFDSGKGYKQTEAGVIPEDWDVDSLASVTPKNEPNGIVDGPFGSNLKTIHYRKSGIPIITSGYVTDGRFAAESYLYADKEKFEEEKRSAVRPGDIVMAKIGARCGASAILPQWHQIGILSGNALKITVDGSRHSTFYVWQILWDLYSAGRIEPLKTVGAQPAISMANLKKYKLALPSLPEQLAIATVLSDTYAELTALEQKLDKTKAIKHGMIQELLTGRIRLT